VGRNIEINMDYKLLFENFKTYLSEQDVVGTTPETYQDLEGQRILLIGDSQVAGHMGRQLERQLTARGATVLRLGHVGAGAKWWNRLLGGQQIPRSANRRKQVVDRPSGRGVSWVGTDRNTWKEQIDNFSPTSVVMGSLGGNDRRALQNDRFESHGNKEVLPLLDRLKTISDNVTWAGPAPTGQGAAANRKRTAAAANLGKLVDSYNELSENIGLTGVNYHSVSDLLETHPELESAGNNPSRKYWGDKLHFKSEPAQHYAERVSSFLENPRLQSVVPTGTGITGHPLYGDEDHETTSDVDVKVSSLEDVENTTN
jgi:hypothetical protein